MSHHGSMRRRKPACRYLTISRSFPPTSTDECTPGRVVPCVRDVRDMLATAAIPHIFLKGAARLPAYLPGADLQFSGDVDVIVPAEQADRALATLRGAGYQDIRPSHKRDEYATSHHREPLRSPHVDLPFEVHVTIGVSSGFIVSILWVRLARRYSGIMPSWHHGCVVKHGVMVAWRT
jgi:hypothetical protein